MQPNIIYRFREPQGGKLGEMPTIEIWVSDEIPPLNKAYTIQVHSWYPDELTRSEISVVWWVANPSVWLKLWSRVEDARFKRQYRQDPALAEKVTAMLLLPELRGKCDENYRRIEINARILKEEIPEGLWPFVAQVEVWTAFFKQPHLSHLCGHHYIQVEEGYYLAYISASCLRLGVKMSEGEAHDIEGGCLPESVLTGFDFDPKTEPPTVMDEGIYWTLEEYKVRVALPHDSSNERVAGYYGYLDAFRKHVKEKAEYRARMDAASKANDAEDAEKAAAREAALRQALFES